MKVLDHARTREGGCSITGKFVEPGGDGGATGDTWLVGLPHVAQEELDQAEDHLAWLAEGCPFVEAGDLDSLDRKRRVLRALGAIPEQIALGLLRGDEDGPALRVFALELGRLQRLEMKDGANA